MRVVAIVLKIGLDRPIEPVQLGTKYQSNLVKLPRTGQKWKKQGTRCTNDSLTGLVLKTMVVAIFFFFFENLVVAIEY